MTTKTNPSLCYSSQRQHHHEENDDDDQLFSDEQIQRYDADTIKHRYGENWRNYASNVREIKQADGSIVREYIIDDPNLLHDIKPIATAVDSTSSSTGSDDEQQLSKHKFAQIKAKFEQKACANVMASPSSSSIASSNTTSTTHRSSNKSNRRDSNQPPPPPMPNIPAHTSQRPQSVSNSSIHRLNSADEADEEVQRIHRQGEKLRQSQATITPVSSIPEEKRARNVEYEVVDEDGNPMAIEGVQDLIKMSGVTAREVPQPDGTVIREYVIDDPKVLSKFQSQQSPMTTPHRSGQDHIPPPPPRIPLRQSAIFRQGPINNDKTLPVNIQHVHVLEPQRRYEYTTTTGKRIEFMVTNIGPGHQMTNDSDIQELSNAINTRLLPSTVHQPQQPFTLPKQWHPAVDLTHREAPNRQRTGSDNQQPIPNNYNQSYQQIPAMPTDLTRSASYGAINQGYPQQQFAPVFAEPIIDWSAVRQQDPHGQVDPQFIQQFITQKHQNGSFQSSAQFLPEQQTTRSTHSPPRTNAPPVFYQQQQQQQQQPISHPYQGVQQQQQPTIMYTTGHTRI